MKCTLDTSGIHVELSERNLLSLLVKLRDPASSRTLAFPLEKGPGFLWVKAVPDEEAYAGRDPGPVRSKDEDAIRRILDIWEAHNEARPS